jgi:MFS family permease
MPAYGSLSVPAAALLSDGAERMRLHQGAVFGLSSLAWSGGQAAASVAAGGAAQATSDLVPGFALAGLYLVTVVLLVPISRTLPSLPSRPSSRVRSNGLT